jgi:uncharacterized protein YbaR (Trm112 family)
MGKGGAFLQDRFDVKCIRCGSGEDLKVYHARLELICTNCDVYYPLLHSNIPVINEEKLREESRFPYKEAEKQQRAKEKELDKAHNVSV